MTGKIETIGCPSPLFHTLSQRRQKILPIAHGWFSDARYPSPDFAPAWEVLQAHPSGYEMVFVTSDSGYGTVLWIPLQGIDPTLLAMCAEYATSAPPAEHSAEVAT